MTITTLEKVAEITGQNSDNIAAVQLDISRMLELGLLVDVDLHNFSILKAGVSWAELGINQKDERRSRMRTGTKYLAPAKYVKKLQTLEVRLRQCLDKYAYNVTGFRPWRWVPFTAYESWQADWNDLLKELDALKKLILAHYEDIQAENREYFVEVAKKAWRALQAGRDGYDEAVVVIKGKAFEDYYAFEDYIVLSALERMPTPADIYAISADYHTGYLVAPPEALAAKALKDKAQAEANLLSAQASKEAAEAQLLWDKERELDASVTAQEIKLRAMREAELEHAREQLEKTISPFTEVVQQFRDRIYADVVSISDSIARNGTLVGKVAGKARKLREVYDLLGAATGDTELRDAIDSLHNALDRVPPAAADSKYDIGAVNEALANIAKVAQEDAHEVRRNVAHESWAGLLEL